MKNISTLVCGIKYPPETFLDRLITGLTKTGIEVTVACDQQPDPAWLSGKNRKWQWSPSWNVPHYKRLLNTVKLVLYLPNWNFHDLKELSHNKRKSISFWERYQGWYQHMPFGNSKWDIVYFPWVLAADRHLDWFLHRNIPIVVSLRGAMVNIDPLVPDKKKQIREKLARIFSVAAAVHCVSQDILDEAIQYGLDPAKAKVIRPAVDPNFFIPSAHKTSNARFTILTTGSLIWRKGYEYALLALRQVIDCGVDAEFNIIGEGPERQRILYAIQDLGLQDRVLMHGEQSPAQVRDRLQQADAFLLASLSEGISNAVLEAMACGLPVVTTNSGGMREAVTDGVEGFIVPLRESKAMAQALQKLAINPDLRCQMGQNARERILSQFDLKDQISAFVSLFSSVMENK